MYMSALPPKADTAERDRHVRFVPEANCLSLLDHLVGSHASAQRACNR
jgi:hypothetical protein